MTATGRRAECCDRRIDVARSARGIADGECLPRCARVGQGRWRGRPGLRVVVQKPRSSALSNASCASPVRPPAIENRAARRKVIGGALGPTAGVGNAGATEFRVSDGAILLAWMSSGTARAGACNQGKE